MNELFDMTEEEIEKLKKENVIVVPYGLYLAGDLIQKGIEIGIRTDEKSEFSVLQYSHDINELIEKIKIAKEKMEKLPDPLPDDEGIHQSFYIYRGKEYK